MLLSGRRKARRGDNWLQTRRQTLEWNQTFTGVHIVWIVDEERGKEPPSQPVLCQPFLACRALTMVFKATRYCEQI